MAEQLIETTVRTALWRQFGATIDMLENALMACPASLWSERLWNAPSDHSQSGGFPPEFPQFWYIVFHTLVWLDMYLSGVPEEEFAPPAPFAQGELDSVEALPKQPYTKDELHGYLMHLRKKCQTTITELSDERVHHQFTFPWPGGMTVSFLELQLYNMRHVQEHAAQLSLFLGQHDTPDETLDWVAGAKGEADL